MQLRQCLPSIGEQMKEKDRGGKAAYYLESVTAISDTGYYLLLWGCSTRITSDLQNSTFFVIVFFVVSFTGALAGPVRPRLSGVPPCSQTTWTVLNLFLLSRFSSALPE